MSAVFFVALGVLVRSALGGPAGAKGTFCGSSGCTVVPLALAKRLSQRDEIFDPASTPRRAPFYRINIKGSGEGFGTRTIIWVPSLRLWYVKEINQWSKPGDGYWRTEYAALDPALGRLAHVVKPFPAPKHWTLPT